MFYHNLLINLHLARINGGMFPFGSDKVGREFDLAISEIAIRRKSCRAFKAPRATM
jgi:hypothetical protein